MSSCQCLHTSRQSVPSLYNGPTFPLKLALPTGEKSQHTDFNEDKTNESAIVWPVATHCCESWTLRKNEETLLEAFEMKGLRKILRVSCTAKETNEWVLNKARVNKKGNC